MKGLCVYEKSSEAQQKLAGQSIQMGKEFHVVEKENCVPESVERNKNLPLQSAAH